jgi:hypothetical protein
VSNGLGDGSGKVNECFFFGAGARHAAVVVATGAAVVAATGAAVVAATGAAVVAATGTAVTSGTFGACVAAGAGAGLAGLDAAALRVSAWCGDCQGKKSEAVVAAKPPRKPEPARATNASRRLIGRAFATLDVENDTP